VNITEENELEEIVAEKMKIEENVLESSVIGGEAEEEEEVEQPQKQGTLTG
jgi:hypothetical protein